MRDGKVVAVVVPAFEEGLRVARVVRRIPPWVDTVVVVDDGSRDGTAEAARQAGGERLVVVRHASNRGVGRAIVTGYHRALELGADVLAVMAGDDQMDPEDLVTVVGPVLSGEADYVKGNRFVHAARSSMPLGRRAAGKVLAGLTRFATGLRIDDSQCGYTALSSAAARALPLDDVWPRYGYPNDLLALLARAGFTVREVPVRPVYQGETSGVRPWHALVVAGVVARRWGSTFTTRSREEPGRRPNAARDPDRSIGRVPRASGAS